MELLRDIVVDNWRDNPIQGMILNMSNLTGLPITSYNFKEYIKKLTIDSEIFEKRRIGL
jgi:hypothetical protein